jgi:hypothetical protein
VTGKGTEETRVVRNVKDPGTRREHKINQDVPTPVQKIYRKFYALLLVH